MAEFHHFVNLFSKDDCDNGDYIKIRECDDRDKDQDWLFYDCTVRPKRNPNLCFTAGESRNLVGRIRLRPCDDDEDLRQKFRLYDPDDRREKFQFKILGKIFCLIDIALILGTLRSKC